MSQNRVGIGTTTPAFLLDVQGDPASTALTIINSKANYSGVLDIKAFDGHSVTMDGHGIGGEFTGGFKGINAHGLGGASTGTVIGVHASASGTAGTRYGVYGTASGGTANVGVLGNVSGGAGNVAIYGLNANTEGYAGYFLGRGHFTEELRAGMDLIVDNALWTNMIRDQDGGMDISSTTDIQLTIDRNNSGIFGFFEIFNGQGEHVFAAGESGNTYSYNHHTVYGNLGIGTTSPITRLHIPTGSDASFSTHGFIQTGMSDGWNLVMDDNEILARNNGMANDLYFQRDSGDVVLCALEQGSVGIGVTEGTSIPDGYMLAVDGQIITEDLLIQNSDNWPDYVFADNYELMSLEDLKTLIQHHKHLPNIPPAQTIAREGILVGDMQRKMMEKIEELTLYIIQLHDTIVRQQGEIENLKSTMQSNQYD